MEDADILIVIISMAAIFNDYGGGDRLGESSSSGRSGLVGVWVRIEMYGVSIS